MIANELTWVLSLAVRQEAGVFDRMRSTKRRHVLSSCLVFESALRFFLLCLELCCRALIQLAFLRPERPKASVLFETAWDLIKRLQLYCKCISVVDLFSLSCNFGLRWAQALAQGRNPSVSSHASKHFQAPRFRFSATLHQTLPVYNQRNGYNLTSRLQGSRLISETSRS